MGEKTGGRVGNEVTTNSRGIITSVLRGKQTGATIRALADEIQKQTDIQRAQHKKVLTLSDIRELKSSDGDSEARLESKKLLSLPGDASAILGNPGVLGMTMYLVRIVKSKSKIRFFTSERKARAWLEDVNHPQQRRSASVSLVAGVFIGLIGLLALVGWQIDNSYLMRWSSSFQPMNPLAAIGLVVIGYGFICYWRNKLKQLKIAGVFGVILGVAVLLPWNIDSILFGQKVIAAGIHAQLADAAAICFIAVGVSPFTVGTKRSIVRLFQYGLAIAIIGLSLFNIFGQLYAPDTVYGISGSFIMSLNLAIAFLAVGITLILLVLYRQIGDVLSGVTRVGWLVAFALIFSQMATYNSWSQVVAQNKANSSEAFLSIGDDLDASLDQRVQAYTSTLYGFDGLFAASDYVDQGEFESYYNSLQLSTTYPGLRTLSFISKIQEKDIPAFIAKHRADDSLHPGGNPTFVVTGKSDATTHYVVTYLANSNAAPGADLGSDSSRLKAFQKADTLDSPISSGTVQLAGMNGAPAQKGFFITLPVASKASGTVPIGFVNAVFNYEGFFAHAFTSTALANGLKISITDTMDGTEVYRSKNSDGASNNVAFSRVVSLPVADRVWNMNLSAQEDFGISSQSATLPQAIFIGGQAFSVLLIVILILQARARRQGFELADSITEDLEHERNRAVAKDQKSGAILSSIGDAVFAVDKNQRITLFNPSAERISGFSEAEVIGKRYDEMLRFEFEKTGHVNNRFVHEALEGKLTSMANHTVLIRKDGKRVPVADSAAPISDSTRKNQGAIIVFRDVTKDYELDRAKSEFVSLASHQLRTPLSAINWYGEMLLNGDAGLLSKDQHEYIQEIFEGNQRMIELVNSLLDVSRLEVGKLANQPALTSIAELIDSLEKELTPGIKSKQLQFNKTIGDMSSVMADPKQLRMIVQNLLSNAVKYTPAKGSVTVTLRKATAADMKSANLTSHTPHWYFSVQDTGYGIPEDGRDKIFSKLYRADNVRKLDVEGTGLGLYIVKEVVKKLGGRVWFTSMESIGTTFYVVLPLKSGARNDVVQ
jgi:PAS domain S-box-containing protein